MLCKKGTLFLLVFCILLCVCSGCSAEEEAPTSSSDASLSRPVQEETSSATETEEASDDMEESTPTLPYITCDKEEYLPGETVLISFGNTATKDWVGFYAGLDEPGTVNSITWKYAEGSGILRFPAATLGGAGEYTAYLCENDGYRVLAAVTVCVLNDDPTDYGVTEATVEAQCENGIRSCAVNVTPTDGKALTYVFSWGKNGKRLEGYTPIRTVTHSGKKEFRVAFNDCMYMPSDADSIEIAVKEGNSTPLYVPVSSELKIPSGKPLYTFNVLSDLHITQNGYAAQRHLQIALEEILTLSPDSIGIFTCGDNTNSGSEADYKLLFSIIDQAGEELPPMHFALGNHDLVYGGGYDKQLSLFQTYTQSPGAYYSRTVGGTKFIFLGSDTLDATGTVGEEQLAWLQNELASTDATQPVFLFLHQPLIETVSGSLYSKNHEIQDWYGIVQTGDRVREILAQYPNAFLFTGHTHWQFSDEQPILVGKGVDANFVNSASVGYLWSDDDVAVGGSQGLFVEVYDDYILLRGREFVSGSWCASAQFLLPLYHA